ncbi:UDP-N-acetylmuramoyl-L-alanyl-D-glutamate--2,6-diaminopimelate ligase [Halobacillus fulvus]|nr:UDP-N-acetylmuramoyl-L-alanyl-D-glutamate--2,6-diaminopimelate ligase [Halobacillus fulvus]
MNTKEYSLNTLLEGSVQGPRRQPISSVVYDSREVAQNDAFVCITGEHQDGHQYIDQAIRKGAKTIIGTDSQRLHTYADEYPSVSFICVSDSRAALAGLASAVCEYPSESLFTVGVTGTNGKTTVSSFIYTILNQLSIRTGCIGTAGIWDDRQKTDFKQTVPTTPESPDIQRVLKYFCEQDMQAAVIESTSIALDQKRLDRIEFDVAVHTNLTPEHLEFHGTMEAYKQAKMKLFDQSKTAVVNVDDDGMAADLLESLQIPYITYGFQETANVRADQMEALKDGTTFQLTAFGKAYEVHAPLFGRYNISNLLAAVAACHQKGFTIEEILSVLCQIKTPEGRFQIVKNDAPFQILLDYAHTPDALENVLQAARQIPHKKLIVMITGIGLRDPKKRPLMARITEGLADEIIVSVDQPGHADRRQVVNDVMEGFRHPESPHIHSKLYREEAIHYAFDLAETDDLVLLTGIGFGGYQIIGDEKVPYSELNVIEDYFAEKKVVCETIVGS